ncbi:RHS repeat-associated core domain-containing protein [Clostridium saccharoperbutylacetonicum]|uniref:RHS repeat-associated core domain-containing protein n=1 Tax=Clostridium saccharoperbutylacetonicum TaxID=36745 RepID=UPI0039E7EE41
MTDKNQQVKNEYCYDAFCNVLHGKEDVHNRLTYTGQQFDGVTGQYYLRARFYNPVIGRFIQEDIYRGDGLNLYSYCSNNPTLYYDPSGYNGVTKQCLNKGTNTGEEKTKKFDTTNTSTRVVGDNGQTSVYRVIRPDEDPSIGLVAKKPDRNMTTTGHVTSGSRNKGSQFISTTTNIDVANTWADKTGNKIVKIDLSKLPDEAKIYDLSTDVGRATYIKGSTANRLAKASSEVLVEGEIPSTAINVIRE